MLAAFVAAGLCLSGTAALAGGGGGNNNDQGQNEGNGGTPATAKVPDGGTTLVSGITQYSESGSQFGAPILGKIPVIDRGFTNVGYGRSVRIGRTTASVRIIDLAEEEFRQTGYRSR